MVAYRQRHGGGSGPGFRGGERAAVAVSSFDAAMQSMTLYQRQPDQALNITEKAYSLATRKMTTLIDSGCSRHMFGMKRFFDLSPNYQRMTAPVMVGNGQVIYAEGMGDIFLTIEVGGKKAELHLANCLYVPQLSSNLISISQLDKAGSDIMFTEGKAILRKNNKMTLIGKMLDTNLYEVNAKSLALPKMDSANTASISGLGNIWHQRLGHLGGNSIRNLKDSVDGFDQMIVPHQCESCILGKMTRAQFPDSSSRSTEPLQLITFDLAGPFDEAIGGAKYFMIMVDDYSKYYHVELLRTKSEATRWLKQVLTQWENQLSRSVKVLRSDGGGEFDNRAISQFCEEKGIRAQMTTARTPEQNGAAERAVRTIKEGTRTLLIDSGLSNKYWGAAAKNFAYVRNRTRTAKTGEKTPIELFTGKRPSVSHLRVFGCVAYMHIPKEDRVGQIWKPNAKRCIFLGYGEEELKAKKAWTLFDPYALKKHVTVHVKFCEDQRWADQKTNIAKGDIFFQDISPAIGEAELIVGEEAQPVDPEIGEAGPRIDEAGPRINEAEPEILDPRPEIGEAQPEIGEAEREMGEVEREIGEAEPEIGEAPVQPAGPIPLPPSRIPVPVDQQSTRKKGTGIWKNYEYVPVPAQGSGIPQVLPDGARRSRQAPKRFHERAVIAHGPKLEDILDQAFLTSAEMNPADPIYLDAKLDEMASMAKNQVWTLVPRQTGQPKPISVRWVCTMKDLPDGSQKPKARLVARGYTQKAGIDYQEIFAPVVKLESIRYIIARACQRQMVLSQGDVKTAFLSSSMEGETVYIEQPEGFREPGKEDHVCLLNRAIYGLHQSPRLFYRHIRKILGGFGFSSISADQSVFVKDTPEGKVLLGLYVDDALVAGDTNSLVQETKALLNTRFEMKWTDDPKVLLGIEIEQDREKGTITLSQKNFAREILEQFNMIDCHPVKTPVEEVISAFPSEDRPPPDTRFPFREFIGKANYLARGTRPDLSFAISHLASFCSTYQETHWKACERVMKYLQGTIDASLVYHRDGNQKIAGYSDAEYAGDKGDRKSVGAYVFTLANGPVSWQSKKQTTVAWSSMEAEYIALGSAGKEAVWLSIMDQELGFHDGKPVTIFEDNQPAIALAKNPTSHARTKHIDVLHHALRGLIEDKKIEVEYLNTKKMIADLLTKPITGKQLQVLCDDMNLRINRAPTPISSTSE
jgi:hypothetical protein